MMGLNFKTIILSLFILLLSAEPVVSAPYFQLFIVDFFLNPNKHHTYNNFEFKFKIVNVNQGQYNSFKLNFIIGTRWPLTHTNTASFKEQHSIPLILSMSLVPNRHLMSHDPVYLHCDLFAPVTPLLFSTVWYNKRGDSPPIPQDPPPHPVMAANPMCSLFT